MKLKYVAILMSVGGLISIGAAMPAVAAGRTSVSVSFFAGADGPVANGSAHWTRTQSTDTDPFSGQIDVPEGAASS